MGARAFIRRYRLIFFATFVVLFTLAVAAADLGRETAPFGLIFVPALSALIVAAAADGMPGVVRLFARIARWRVAPRWYLAAIGIPLAMWIGIALAGLAMGAQLTFMQNPADLLIVFLVVLLPGLIEEFGWRGYGVPITPRSWPMIVSALVVGVLFLVPHIPLYLPGNLYDNLPLWPLPLIILSYAVILTWVYYGSGGSALLTGLTHAALNGFTPLSRGIDEVQGWELHGIAVTVVAVVLAVLSSSLRRPVDDALPDLSSPRISELPQPSQ
jgi:membrane protease YdiL (CAAX protease family)